MTFTPSGPSPSEVADENDPAGAEPGSPRRRPGSSDGRVKIGAFELPIPRILAEQPEEVWFFLRISAYAIFIGAVYWFVSYEAGGTMLLLGFGLAAGFATGVLAIGAGSQRRTVAAAPAEDAGPGSDKPAPQPVSPRPDGPFGDESGRIPAPTTGPLVLAIGVAFVALGAVFGPWLIIVGAGIGLWGAVAWARAITREYRAVDPELARGAPARGRRGAVAVSDLPSDAP